MNGSDPDLDKYIAGEILDYYGEETVNAAKATSAPSQGSLADKHRTRRAENIRTVLSVFCAVMFLTGSVILAISIMNYTAAVRQDTTAYTDTDTLLRDSDAYGAAVSEQSTDSAIDSMLSAEESLSDDDSMMVSEYTSSVAEGIESENLLDSEESTVPDNRSEPSSVESTAGESTAQGGDNSLAENTNPDNSSEEERGTVSSGAGREYVLPSAPYDSTTSVETIDNPVGENGTVVTGGAVYAGIGLVLMILSLAVSVVLHKQRRWEDY